VPISDKDLDVLEMDDFPDVVVEEETERVK